MPLIIPNGFAQATIVLSNGAYRTGFAVVTLGLGGLGLSNLQSAVDDFNNAVFTNIRPQLDVEVSHERTELRTDDEYAENTDFWSGQNGLDALPPNCAVLVTKVNSLRGRKNQGRFYWPSLVGEENVDEAGTIAGAQLTAIQTAFDDFHSDLIAAALEPVILHNSEGAGVEPPPTPVTSFGVQSKIATQRRRLR